MANKTASVHATKKKSKHGKVKGMHIKAMRNGAMSTLMHEPPEDSMYPGEVAGDETLHPTMGHLVKHIKANLGDHFAANTGSGGAPATQPASTPNSGGSAGNNDAGADEDEE